MSHGDRRTGAILTRPNLSVEEFNDSAVECLGGVDVRSKIVGGALIGLALALHANGAGEARDLNAGVLENAPNLGRLAQEHVGGGEDGLIKEAANLHTVVAVFLGARGNHLKIPV